MRILVKVPTKHRFLKFKTMLLKYIDYQVTDNVTYLVTYDDDDPIMIKHKAEIESWGNVKCVGGMSKSKIHACNRNVEGEFDILVLASDDMIVQERGWDKYLIECMKIRYPDTDGVLWFNDGYTGNKLNTMCILGKKYYERFHYIYHPSYDSLFSDNEFMEVANKLKKQTYFKRVLFKHEHPANNGFGYDLLYKKNDTKYHKDHSTWLRRKAKGYEIVQ